MQIQTTLPDERQPGQKPSRSLSLYALLGAALMVLLGASIPGLAQSTGVADPGTLQVIADGVLIDARCRNAPVDLGALLRYGEARGISASDILPLGPLRKPFDLALSHRLASIDVQALCTSIVTQEQELAPGVIKQP